MAVARVKNDLSEPGGGSGGPVGWDRFCESHARTAALDFAEAFRRFVADSTAAAGSGYISFSHRDFMRRFVDVFQECFEHEIRKCNQLNGYAASSSTSSLSTTVTTPAGGIPSANNYTGSLSRENLCDPTSPTEAGDVPGGVAAASAAAAAPAAARSASRSLFQRLGSFKQLTLRKGRSVFHKQRSDEMELSPSRGGDEKPLRGKLSKMVVEVKYQGIVNYLTGDSPEAWSRCRLALVRTAAGHLLEFFTPPKAVKPKSGVFCFLVTEARETTALEMPDRENTFVLRAENGLEYVIEARGAAEMRAWLTAIRASMRPAGTNGDPAQPGSLPHSLTSSEGALLERPLVQPRLAAAREDGAPPELPPRPPEAHAGARALPGAAGAAVPASGPAAGAAADNGWVDAYGELHEYPWFHGTLARADAAQLVLQEAQLGHGTFLVRQSETRVGDYVLTFNYQGRPKHVRLTISEERQCRVQHLWFNSVFTMLEHFRVHPIPLESGGSSDVTLGEFVLVPRRPADPAGAGGDARPRPPPSVPDLTEVRTYGGSVRLRCDSLERLEQQAGQGKRAVDNTYSFV